MFNLALAVTSKANYAAPVTQANPNLGAGEQENRSVISNITPADGKLVVAFV